MARLEIELDLKGFDASAKAISDVGTNLGALGQKQQQVQKEFAKASQTAKELEGELKKLQTQVKSGAISQDTFEKETKEVREALSSARQASQELQSKLTSLNSTIKQLSTTEKQAGDETKKLKGYHDSFSSGVRSTNSVSLEFTRSLSLLSPALSRYAGIISDVSLANGGAALSFSALSASAAAASGRLLAFAATPLGAAIVGLGALYLLIQQNKEAVKQFNSGLIDTGKTVGIAGEGLNRFGESVINLSNQLEVVSSRKLLDYTTAAGQLGIKGTRDILNFAEALAKLEVASDISGQEGARSIARLLNIVDGGVKNIKAFGDEIVNLGVNSAATEGEILRNALLIAQNTGLYKIGRQEVLAYASATKAVGLSAEIVGSSFARTLGIFEKSIRTGNNLNKILQLTGISAAEINKEFSENASGVFQRFIEGLNGISQAGGSVQAALDEIGLKAVRDRRVIATLATGGYDELARSMELVGQSSNKLDSVFEANSQKIELQTQRIGIAWDNVVVAIENGTGIIGKSAVTITGAFADILTSISTLATSNSWKDLFTRLGILATVGSRGAGFATGITDALNAQKRSALEVFSEKDRQQMQEVLRVQEAIRDRAFKNYGRSLSDAKFFNEQQKRLLDMRAIFEQTYGKNSKRYSEENVENAEQELTSISDIQKRITDLKKQSGSAIKGSPVFNEIKELQARLKELNGGTTGIKLEAEPGSFAALQKQLSDLRNKSDSSVIGSDTFKQIQELEKRIKVLGNIMKNPVTLSEYLKKNFEDAVKALDKMNFDGLKIEGVTDVTKAIDALVGKKWTNSQGQQVQLGTGGSIDDVARQAHEWNQAISAGLKKTSDKTGQDFYQAFSRGVDKFATDFYDVLTGINKDSDATFGSIFSKLTTGFTSSFSNVILGTITEGLTASFKDAFKNIDFKNLGKNAGLAIAAGASLVGGVISGATRPTSTAGQALGGALSAAGAGFMVGGPVGAVVGGVVGAIGGIFGSSAARKRERELEKQQLEATKANTEALRKSALTFTSAIIGQQTTGGIVTGLDRDAFGNLVATIAGRDIKLSMERETAAQLRGL